MKTIFLVFKIVAVLLSANENLVHSKKDSASVGRYYASALEQSVQLVNDTPDEEPIFLHTKIKRPNLTPIQGATVTLTLDGNEAPAFSGTSNETGDVTFSGIEPGTYILHISATGFQDKNVTLYISDDVDRVDVLEYE